MNPNTILPNQTPQMNNPNNFAQPQNPVQNTQNTQPIPNPQNSPQKDPKPAEKPHNQYSTQNFLRLATFKDNSIIMKDGSFRSVISCKSINFDLMSTAEREGVEYSYQSFLNSLYFPIQILIRSDKVDIGPYLEKLSKIRSSQDNMLLNILMDDYIRYIDYIAQEANIMDKTFYIIVNYNPNGEDLSSVKNAPKNFFSSFFGNNNVEKTIKINSKTYIKAKEELQNRTDSVLNGLIQMGVNAKRLDVKQLSQLFYGFYNPDISNQQPLVDFNIAPIYTKKGN